MDKPLSSKQFKLLTTLVDNRMLFDKQDNCFQVDTKVLAAKSGVNIRNIQRLLKDLKERELTKKVKDVVGVTRLMLNPTFLYNHHKEEYYFTKAQYMLGSYEEASVWSDSCRETGFLVDPETGEIISLYDYSMMGDYKDSYRSTDRTKQRSVAKSSNLEDIYMPVSIKEDEEFFAKVNELSEYKY